MNILPVWFVFGLLGLIEAAEYCTEIGPTGKKEMFLGEVILFGEEGTKIEASKYCGTHLRDLTQTHIAHLYSGNTYSIEWGSSTCGNESSTSKGRVWIDWPGLGWKNGVLYTDDVITSFSTDYGTFEGITTFTVPADTAAVTTRMRAMVVQDETNPNPDAIHPCSQFAFGGTTDFGIVISSPPKYCTDIGPTSDLDSTLGSVSITGAQGSGFTVVKYCGEGLRDLTATHTVKLIIGQTYTITWGADTCGDVFYAAGTMWIDWLGVGWRENRDYTDDELSPVINYPQSGTTTTQFTVPAHAKVGITRMRGMVIEDSYPDDVRPCRDFPFGGVTDFGVEIFSS